MNACRSSRLYAAAAGLAIASLSACGGEVAAAANGVVVDVEPSSAQVGASTVQQFTATVTGSANTAVTWSVLEGAPGGAVDSTGHYTAPGSTGTFHVVATSAADPTKSTAAVVSVTPLPPPISPAAPMPLVSRNVPATSSAGTAAWGKDASYGGIEWGFHMAEIGGTGWLAYDLSSVPPAQRDQLLVALYMGKGDQYYQLNFPAASGYVPEFTPNAYVLEGATSASGPWTALVTVGVNNNPFKSHALTFTGYTFLRFRCTAGPNGCRVKMDAYDASGGIGDGFVFYGDSITTNVFSGGFNGYGPEWFSKQIQASHAAFFPFVIGGGYPFTTSGDARDLIVLGTGGFATGLPSPLSTIFRNAKYAALVFGANDAPDATLVSGFRANYAQIIDALRAVGQTVVLASPTWSSDTTRQAGLVRIRAAIGFHLPPWAAGSFTAGAYAWNGGRAYLCTTGGTSVTGPVGTGTGIADGGTARWSYVPTLREDYAADPGVIGGPDLYSVFLNHPEWLGDGLHPNATGEVQWRGAWVSWALRDVYR
jgi:lysophospholipase L1-like esterase